MIDLGVATSIASNNHYSWQDTVNFTKDYNLNTIQFYIPQETVLPQLSEYSDYKNCYLHFPNDYNVNLEKYIKFSKKFKLFYNTKKVIIHQKEDQVLRETKIIVNKCNLNNLAVGIENEGSAELYSYFKLIEYLQKSKLNIFAVIDIHRFYYNYISKYKSEEFIEMITKLLRFCHSSKINIILHVIDSKSFNSNRYDWVPIFEGIIPYSKLLDYIFKENIYIESIIFEYESLFNVIKSLENMKKFGYYNDKY